ncbi:hypothetical protein FACS1894174_00360 [Bacteroidia bacterium]|nr:hypothetical protein FACS1894203_1580 [Bacteroidia bacterium]GHV19784.1 hypothetical protein FACS1894174_00360 [Bacteroidia bacterium]
MFYLRVFIFILILSFCLPVSSSCENTNVSGLLFKTGEEQIDYRTSLDLYNGKYQKITDSFSIRFDISIWDIKSFGYVFRLVNKNQDEISLVFVNFRGEDSLYFDFNSNISNRYIYIPVPKEQLNKGNWLTINMHFNLKTDKAIITVQGKSITCNPIGLKNPDEFLFIFGLYGTNLDVASMAIRNVSITKQNDKKELFPLDESQGNLVHNSKNVIKGYVKNPVWLINKHYKWKKLHEFTASCIAGITFDEKIKEIIIVNTDSINTFDTKTSQLSSVKIPGFSFRTVSGEAVCCLKKNCYYIYNFDDTLNSNPSFAIINRNISSPDVTFAYPKMMNRLHHHNVFFFDDEEDLFIFGGYGRHTYSNAFYKYNYTNARWDSIHFTGDTILPRFFAASGAGPGTDEILIFGGFGNESGRQELGGKNIYDLHLVNLKSKTIKKLWEQKTIKERFVPCGNLILNRNKTHFYSLCYPHHIAQTELKLYQFDSSTGIYEVVSDGIPFLSEKIESKAYIFFDEFSQAFYAVTREYIDREKSKVCIYFLLSPPVNLSGLKNKSGNQSMIWTLLFSVLSVIILVSIGITMILRDRKYVKLRNTELPQENKNEEPNLKTMENTEEIKEENLSITKNAIYILGDFIAFDKKGNDITYRFSPKLKSLFALVMLNSSDNQSGITTERLTADLWPEKNSIQVKNIRGVTINHFRNILNDINGIKLIHNHTKWSFLFENEFYCDYLYILKTINEIEPDKYSEESIGELTGLLRRGTLLRNIQTEWADDYKQKFESTIEQVLSQLLSLNNDPGNYQTIINLSEALFVIDPLNEKVLLLTIRLLKNAGKIEYSQNLYNRFSSRYKALMGKTYPLRYSSI